MFRPDPVTLDGSAVLLVPLTSDHLDALCEVGFDPDIWRWMPVKVHDRATMRAFVDEALAAVREGTAVAFATVERATSQVVGSTRFLNIVPAHRRVEIGATWIAPAWQRSPVNTEAKYLMLRHAFEQWRCLRVEFKTDARNTRSRDAILRLGAVEEGVFRKHMVREDGTSRDSVYFSLVDGEWAAAKARLEERLARPVP
jgi:RimJ/RimL family protein N-acetyltransferase